MESLLRCPLCAQPLDRQDTRYLCPRGHSFDRAAAGYVHLLPANKLHSKDPGDDKAMAAARNRFLSGGYYDPLRDALTRLALAYAPDRAQILDAGCGEGYYSAALFQALLQAGKHPRMAGVDARSTGKVGVCMATSGPGATNLVTGIATAYMDSIPIVAITCNVGVSLLGKDSFQEIDIAGITTPITKYSFIVKDVTKLADTIRRAFSIARKGRPGPVLVDITKDVTANKTEYIKKEPKMPQPDCSAFNEDDLKKAIQMIEKAKKPAVGRILK